MKRYLRLVALLLVLIGVAARIAAAAEPRRPNIVMVFIDDMGWGDFSCFGNREAKTPNIDRLAAEGIRYSQFYVNSPICSPSRTALTTGQYPQRWRITSFLNNRADNERRGMAQWLDPKAPSLARFLHQSGYATGHFGKWHMGGQRDVDDAPAITTYGFDESLTNFEGMGPKLLPLTLKPGDKEPGRIWADAERLGGPATWVLRSKITTAYIDHALGFMAKAQREGRPFYVNLWPDDMHSPYWPPVEKWSDNRHQLYLAVLEEMDRQLAKLFDTIRNTPELRDNTLVLVCSDNGAPVEAAGSNGPFKGGKGLIFEGGIRSPLIVWGPGLVAPDKVGQRNDTATFAAFDLAPSLLRVAHVTAPAGVAFDGEDVSDALLGRSTSARRAPICWRRPPGRENGPGRSRPPALGVREGKWKLLCDYDGSHAELHDLSTDPGEATNVAKQNADVVRHLTDLVVAWHRSMPPDNGPALENAPARAGKRRK